MMREWRLISNTQTEVRLQNLQTKTRNHFGDPEVESNPEKFFDKVIEINLSTLEPHIVGPHSRLGTFYL